MRNDGKNDGKKLEQALRGVEGVPSAPEGRDENEHLVFDFTDAQATGFADLALILTARLHTPPGESVWVRGIPPRTAMILRALGLDHLFRVYPGNETLN